MFYVYDLLMPMFCHSMRTHMHYIHKIIDKVFRDDKGNIVLGQWPNAPLILWLLFKLVSYLPLSDNLITAAQTLSSLSLLVWALLELTKGVNIFRRVLGFVVGAFIILSFVR